MPASKWTVKNPTTQETRGELTDAELASFLTQLPAEQLQQWQFAPSQTQHWNFCSEIPAFRLRRFGFAPIPGDLAMTEKQVQWIVDQLDLAEAMKTLKAEQEEEAEAARLKSVETGQEIDWHERRQHSRHDIKLQVVLISDQHAFRTFTRNASLGGLALEKPVPEALLGSNCTIFLSLPGSTHKISFTGTVIQESSQSSTSRKRITFADMSGASKEALAQWLTEHAKPKENAA